MPNPICPFDILDALAYLCFALAREATDTNQLAGEMLASAANYIYTGPSGKSGRTMLPLLAELEKPHE